MASTKLTAMEMRGACPAFMNAGARAAEELPMTGGVISAAISTAISIAEELPRTGGVIWAAISAGGLIWAGRTV